jgi:hypothetical protein
MKKQPTRHKDNDPSKLPLPGNPSYAADEDIYSQEKKERFNEDEQPGASRKRNNLSLDKDLDIPGTELDDIDEIVGEEDEENNYYSLGGDGHNDLDENNGDRW